jgi:hypothetical protein
MFIYGCAKTEAKLIDLASIVFIMFCLMVFGYLIIPKIVTHPYYRSLHELARPVLKVLSYLLFVVGIGIFINAFFSEGLGRIQFFIGFIIILLGWFMRKYIFMFEDQEQRRRYVRLMILCTTFLLALLFLWSKGMEVLKL